ncbi:MAG: hypothetical protein VYD87_15665 [Pseudomonadota bacterium]|nr:hypothetical protein [Pseudomonadota bacterium]
MIADYALGISLMKREDESLHDYALSFSPLAPFFGVPYRFAALLKLSPAAAMTGFAGASAEAVPEPEPAPALAAPAKAPAKAKKAAAKAKAKTEDLVEAEIEAGAAVAEAVAATVAPAIPDDMAEAAPVVEAMEEAADVAETAVETAAETAAPALLYASAPDAIDDLKLIKGVGPKLESELNGMGIYTFAQVASLTEANLAWIDDNLSTFKGRSVRDDWIGQASKLLAS